MIDPSRWDLPALTAAWRAAQPFAWIAIDRLLDDGALAELRAGITREPHWPNRGELYEMMRSGTPTQPSVGAFVEALGGEAVRRALGAVTGRTLRRVDANSYVYLAGSYLLPHTDWRQDVGRQLAWIHYLSADGSFAGGELDLYRCEVDPSGEIAAAEVALTLPPRENRLVVFDVGPATLHRVREVTAGARISLAGWFY